METVNSISQRAIVLKLQFCSKHSDGGLFRLRFDPRFPRPPSDSQNKDPTRDPRGRFHDRKEKKMRKRQRAKRTKEGRNDREDEDRHREIEHDSPVKKQPTPVVLDEIKRSSVARGRERRRGKEGRAGFSGARILQHEVWITRRA